MYRSCAALWTGKGRLAPGTCPPFSAPAHSRPRGGGCLVVSPESQSECCSPSIGTEGREGAGSGQGNREGGVSMEKWWGEVRTGK